MPLSVQNGKNIIFKKKANLLMLKRLLFGLTLRADQRFEYKAMQSFKGLDIYRFDLAQ